MRISDEGYHIPKAGMVVLARERLKEDGSFIDGKICRVGYTVTKKIGNAVTRNKARRRLRHAAMEVLPTYGIKYHDYVIIARNSTIDRPYESLVKDLRMAAMEIYRNFKDDLANKRLLRDIFETPFIKEEPASSDAKEKSAAEDLKDELADTVSFSSLNISLEACEGQS